jgi:hypothetical protein
VIVTEKRTRNTIDPELASRIHRTVALPEAFLFFTDIGQYTGELAQSLADFLEKLEKIPLKSMEFHFKRGDFERWIRETLGDYYLANRMNKIDRSTQGEELKTTIQIIVKRRIDQLKAAAMTKI